MKWIFVFLLLSVLVSGVSGAEFTDTFQHQLTPVNNWQMFGVIDPPSFHTSGSIYNKEVKFYAPYYGGSNRAIVTNFSCQSKYWSCFLHKVESGFNTAYITANFWDSAGYQHRSFNIYGPFQSDNNIVIVNRYLEFVYESGSIYWRINGVDQGVGCTCSFTPTYFGIGGSKGVATGHVDAYFDDVHTKEGIVGICDESNNIAHTITELTDKEISTTWSTKTIPITTYTTSEYTLQVTRLINSTTINTTIVKPAGNGTAIPYGYVTYNWSTMFGAEGYGTYYFNLYKDTTLIGQDYISYKSLLDDSWINIEKDQCGIGDTMKVTYFLDTPDFTPNDYYIKLYDASGEVKETRGIFASSGTEYFETLGYAAGMAYSLLVKDTEPATDYEDGRDLVELAFDVTNMLDSVFIRGMTYNAETGVPLPNVSINFTQADSQFNTTSDSNGFYEFTYQIGSGDILTNETVEFVTDVLIEANASKPLWWHENFSFTPLVAGTIILDLYLLPDCTNLTHNNNTIAGMTLSYPFHQAVNTANVYIKNSTTYTDSMLSSADMGYYMFNELSGGWIPIYIVQTNETFKSDFDKWVSLAHSKIDKNSQKVTNTTDEIPYVNNTDYVMNYTDGTIKILSTGNMINDTNYHIDYDYFGYYLPSPGGTFYLNATKTGYKDSAVYTVIQDDECEYQNIILHGLYNLTVWAKHAQTHISLTDFNAILNEDEQKSSGSSTSLTFTQIEYGIWKVQVDKEGFYSDVKYVYVAQNTNTTFYLAPTTTSGGEGVGQYYAPPHLVEFRVENIWGRPYENVHINITAQQTTMGAWDWLKSVFGYRDEIAAEIQNGTMNGTTDTYGAMSFMMTETIKYKIHVYNATQGIDKVVYVYPKEERYIIVCSVIRWEQNGTEEMRELTINVTTTTLNSTHANITVEYVDPSNATTDLTFYVNRTTNYNIQEMVASYNVLHDSNETYSFVVTPISGRSFFVRVATVNDEWGTKVWDFAVKFPGLLVDLGLPAIVYPMMAISLILFTGGLFGASSATQGALICCIEGWVFLGMGWFAEIASTVTMSMALSLATVIAILAIMAEKGRRSGVQ